VHGGYTHTADSGSSKRIYQDAVEVLLKCDADRAEGELSYFNDDCTLNNNNPRAKGPGKYLALNQSIDCTPGGGPLLPMQLVRGSCYSFFDFLSQRARTRMHARTHTGGAGHCARKAVHDHERKTSGWHGGS
jgi:hypothetical protein